MEAPLLYRTCSKLSLLLTQFFGLATNPLNVSNNKNRQLDNNALTLSDQRRNNLFYLMILEGLRKNAESRINLGWRTCRNETLFGVSTDFDHAYLYILEGHHI